MRRDEGSATALVALVAVATLAFGLALAAVSVVLVAGSRARSAADLAALAAADAAAAGRAVCDAAAAVADANAARLVSCAPDATGVTVVVEVATARGGHPVRAAARAAPARVTRAPPGYAP